MITINQPSASADSVVNSIPVNYATIAAYLAGDEPVAPDDIQKGDIVILNTGDAFIFYGGDGLIVDPAEFTPINLDNGKADDDLNNVRIASATATLSGNQDVPASWNMKDVLLTVSAASIITFRAANLPDGAAVNLRIVSNAGSHNVTIATDLDSIDTDGTKVIIDGWVTAQRHGNVLYLVGKLK
jgi:hypothetical protein